MAESQGEVTHGEEQRGLQPLSWGEPGEGANLQVPPPAGMAAAGVETAMPHVLVISSRALNGQAPEQPVHSMGRRGMQTVSRAPAGCLAPARTQRARVCGPKQV